MPRPSTSNRSSLRVGVAASTIAGLVQAVAAFVTGLLTARLLGPEGKGEYTVVVTWVLVAGWIASIGLGESLIHRGARHPDRRPGLVSTAWAAIAVLGLVAAAVIYVLAPYGLGEQRAELVDTMRIASIGVFGVIGLRCVNGLLTGAGLYVAAAGATSSHYVMVALALALVGAASTLDLGTAILVKLVLLGLSTLIGFSIIVRSIGVAKPSWGDGRALFSFGSRLHLFGLGELGAAQLDLAVLPAFVEADQIGYYAVAASTATVMVIVIGRLSGTVLGAAAAEPDLRRRAEIVETSIRIALWSSLIAGLCLFVGGGVVIEAVYGTDFAASTVPLRILVPGVVAWTTNRVASAALQAFDLPGRSSASMLVALAVTIVGLVALLPAHGIRGAAVTSTMAYGAALTTTLFFLRRHTPTDLAAVVSPRSLRRDLANWTRR